MTLSWTRATGAAGYDVYMGRDGAMPRLLHNVADTSLMLTGLEDGVEYTWRVEAFAGCDSSLRTTSETGRFVTRNCSAPSRPVPAVPDSRIVPIGRPYVVAWREENRADASRTFLVERSQDEFASIHDRQQVEGTSATFTASAPGAWSHRIIAVGCGGSAQSAVSPVLRLRTSDVSNDVRVLTWPRGVVVARGEELSGHASSIVLENPGGDSLDLRFVTSTSDGTPFFEMVDTHGGSVTDFRLAAGEARKFLIRFGGPSTEQEAQHEGLVAIHRQDGRPLRSPVFARVSLRIGASGTVAPDVLDAFGEPTSVIQFPPASGPGSQDSVFTIQLRNPGAVPLDLTAEVGPDAWLEPESGWNASSIPAGASRTVRLRVRRDRAPLTPAPRQSFIRFRAAGGAAATLRVIDPDAPPLRSGRSGESSAGELSRIVTRATTRSLAQSRTLATTLHLTNASGDDMTVDLTFTPEVGAADPTVSTVSVVVPAYETLTVVDPLATWLGRARPATGQIEVRTAPDRYGALTVSALEGLVQADAITRAIPVVRHGGGAAPGIDRIAVLSELQSGSPAILLVETSGDEAAGRVELADAGGVVLASLEVALPRNGYRVLRAADFSLPGLPVPFEVFVSGTTGCIYPAILVDSDEGAVVIGSVPSRSEPGKTGDALVMPFVVNGPLGSVSMRTTTTFVSTGASTTQFRVTLLTANGVEGTANVSVEPRKPRSYGNVFFQLFGKSISRGSLVIERIAGDGGVIAAGFRHAGPFPRLSEVPVSGIGAEREMESSTILFDGLDQRVDEGSGHDWSLHLVETAGTGTSVSVALFESSGPLAPLATRTVDLAASSRLEIADLIEWIGLADSQRRADRPRLLCVVSNLSGEGSVAAVAVAVDRSTGVVQAHSLTPSGGDARAEPVAPARLVTRADRVRPVRR